MRNTHGVEVAVGLWCESATKHGVVASIEAKQGLRQALFFEDGTAELVRNITLSETFEIQSVLTPAGQRWRVSFPWRLQRHDQDFDGVTQARQYLMSMHPHARPRIAAAKRLPSPLPRSAPRPNTVWDDMDDDIPFLFNMNTVSDTVGTSKALLRIRHGKGMYLLR